MADALTMSDEGTWPVPLRALFEKYFEALRSFEEAERYASSVKYKNWPGPPDPFVNPFQETHDHVLERANELAAGLPIVGRHCTRLHAE